MDNPQTTEKALTRAYVLNGLLGLQTSPSYLEIGVSRGMTFHEVNATRKVAVDPRFRFSVQEQAPANRNASYHEVPSDSYFGTLVARDERFDVIYLDGLHTFEQTLRDLLNALFFLTEKGVIIIDDVYPSSYSAALPSQKDARVVREKTGGTLKQWMGDVYRLVFFIDTFMQQLSFRTVKENHGQLIVWRKPRTALTQRSVLEVASLQYENVLLNEDVFRFAPYKRIRDEYAADMGLRLPESL